MSKNTNPKTNTPGTKSSGQMTSKMTGKKRSSASNTVLFAVFVAGAAVAVNLIGARVFKRVDMTEKKVYTLSQASKDLVGALPDYFTVKAYISEDLPPQLLSVSRYVRDLVDEYQNAGEGKFKWEAVDPATDEKLKVEAQKCNVGEQQIQVLNNTKIEMGLYYLGLCLQYRDKSEAIPVVVQREGLEYRMSSIIKKMTQRKSKIAITTGHGESDLNRGFGALKQILESEYEAVNVNPSTGSIPDDVDAILVGGPTQAIDEKGQKEIDKFLTSGKGVIFFAPWDDVLRPTRSGLSADEHPHGARKHNWP